MNDEFAEYCVSLFIAFMITAVIMLIAWGIFT